MNKLLRLLSDRAHWEALVFGPLNTLITRGLSFAYGYALGGIAIGSRVNERNVQVKAEVIDMLSRFFIVQSVNHDVKLTEKLKAKSILLNLADVGSDFNLRVLLDNLVSDNLSLWPVDMFPPKEELPVQVADINGVQIDNSYLLEASQ